MPINIINEWIDQEKKQGSLQPNRIVLATAGKDDRPHSRVVAIRDISDEGILFFTQRGTRKIREIEENPIASMTLWLPMQQREVMMDGRIKAITQEENEFYWSKKPRESQLRFSAHAETSGRPLDSLQELENKYQQLMVRFAGKEVPVSEFYCGYRLLPDTLIFYTLNDSAFSEIIKYVRQSNAWTSQRLSP